MAGVLLCLEYTRPWIDPRAKGKGKTKTRLWSTLLKRRIDWAVESQVTDSGAGGREGSEDLWFVRYKK